MSSATQAKAKMFLKFELQRALSKSPIGMRCCTVVVLHVQTIMDYILHFSMKFFRRNIGFRDGTSDPPIIERDFCTCFLKDHP